jgi:hypothetical protein
MLDVLVISQTRVKQESCRNAFRYLSVRPSLLPRATTELLPPPLLLLLLLLPLLLLLLLLALVGFS